MLRKRTLRKLPPTTRKYAKLLGDLESVVRRGKNLIEEIQHLELDATALRNSMKLPIPSSKSGQGIDISRENG